MKWTLALQGLGERLFSGGAWGSWLENNSDRVIYVGHSICELVETRSRSRPQEAIILAIGAPTESSHVLESSSAFPFSSCLA